MSSLDQFVEIFFQECDEQLGVLESQLSSLSSASDKDEVLNAAFRAVHSIKGGAGMFGFSRLVDFAHHFESSLGEARSGRISLSDEFIKKAIAAGDVLRDIATATRSGADLPDGYESAALDQLTSIQTDGKQGAKKETKPAAANAKTPKSRKFEILFQPHEDIFRQGAEPTLVMRDLSDLGALQVLANTGAIPELSQLDPAKCHLSWKFKLETDADLEKIRSVFEFYKDKSTLEFHEIPHGPEEKADTEYPKPDREKRSKPKATPNKLSSIRVDLSRIDNLFDLVGEVTISQTMVLQHLDDAMVASNPQLFRAVNQLLQVSASLQEGVMAIRAQPMDLLFARMPRVVRDAAHHGGKKIKLTTDGSDTELDKTIIEQLADPLMHIVRNAVDHGIEPLEERVAAGKPEIGSVHLSASQRGDRIVVEISDDGRGIDRREVRQRAEKLGLVDNNSVLTDQDINSLIFSPGLSTAQNVSEVSGRGVGMDVVAKNIQQLGGRIAVESTPKIGTVIKIVLPVTLAVLDAMQVRAAGENYLIPMNDIGECVVVDQSKFNHIPGVCDFINVRGKQIRVHNLSMHLGRDNSKMDGPQEVVLTDFELGDTEGWIVEEVVGHQQVVVKGIREQFKDIKGISGATILGDGSVALILDLSQMALSQLLTGPSVGPRPEVHIV